MQKGNPDVLVQPKSISVSISPRPEEKKTIHPPSQCMISQQSVTNRGVETFSARPTFSAARNYAERKRLWKKIAGRAVDYDVAASSLAPKSRKIYHHFAGNIRYKCELVLPFPPIHFSSGSWVLLCSGYYENGKTDPVLEL